MIINQRAESTPTMKSISSAKSRLLGIALLTFVASSTCAQSDLTALPKFDKDKLAADFNVFRHSLEEGHSGIYRYTKKPDMDRIFDAAEKSLNHSMDAIDFYRVLAPVVAAIKCGHTSVAPPSDLRLQINNEALLLPMEIRVLRKRPYVFRDFSDLADSSIKPGAFAGFEIRSINGVPSAKIVETMIAATPGDGDVLTSRQVRISGFTFAGNLLMLLGLKSPYDMKLVDPATGKTRTAQLGGAKLPDLREALKARFPNEDGFKPAGELKLLDDGKIAVMTIHQFGGTVDTEKKKGLREFYKESFEEIQAKGSKALILDLRNNGGGEDELGQLLLSYLIDKPFKYYEDLVINNNTFDFFKYTNVKDPLPARVIQKGEDGKYHATGHPNWGIKQPNKPTFTGKVYILINGGSFSTTSEFLSHAHFNRRATFIGEESGGGYYGNSSGFMPTVTLPNTKLTMRVPLMTYYMAVSGYNAAAHGVVPDYPVEYSIAELLAKTDKEMALALALARKPHS
jgi:Peptidase family S41